MFKNTIHMTHLGSNLLLHLLFDNSLIENCNMLKQFSVDIGNCFLFYLI